MRFKSLFNRKQQNIVPKRQYVRPLLSIAAVAAVGVTLLVISHASTASVGFEAEKGNRTPSVQDIFDQNASGQHAIKFAKSVTSPTGKFYIVGKDIIDPQGNKFYPMGGNIAVDGNSTFAYKGTASNHAVDVKNWGWNTVRLTLVCSNSTAGVDNIVQQYTALQIVVTIGCWDVTGANPSLSDSRVVHILNLFDDFATTYKDNPYVWLNPYNEPLTSNDSAAWLSLQNTALTRIRAKAPHNIFVADAPGWGQSAQSFYGSNPVTSLGSGKCNVLYSWHAYGAALGDTSDQTKMDNAVRNVFTNLNAANVPLILGEIGDPKPSNGNDGGNGNNQRAARSAISLGPQYGYGLQWWHLTGDSNAELTFSLMLDKTKAPWDALTSTDTSTHGLSQTGLSFWNLSHNKPNLGVSSGDVASASHCN